MLDLFVLCRVRQYSICWKSSFIRKPYAVASMITSIHTNMAMQKQKTSGMSLASMQINHWMLRYKPIMKFFGRKLSYLPKSIIMYHIKCSVLKFQMHFSAPHAYYISLFLIWWLKLYLMKSALWSWFSCHFLCLPLICVAVVFKEIWVYILMMKCVLQ